MAVTKKRKTAARSSKSTAESQLAVVLEDIRGQFNVFGEALQGLREHMDRRLDTVDRRLDAVEDQLGLLTDAVRTHSKALRTIEAKLDEHEGRVGKLEGAAE
jgi:archaellum component FlaC